MSFHYFFLYFLLLIFHNDFSCHHNPHTDNSTYRIVYHIIKLTQTSARYQLQHLNRTAQANSKPQSFPAPDPSSQNTNRHKHNHICYNLASLYIPYSPRPEKLRLKVLSDEGLAD